MKNNKLIGLIIIIVFLIQVACAIGGATTNTEATAPTMDINEQIAAGIAQTQAAQQQQVPEVPGNTLAPPIILPTNTLEVPATEAATTVVQGTVNYGANCRSGPGGNFLNLVILTAGTEVNIIGTTKATDGDTWWKVSSSGEPDCWLTNEALTISGDTSSVAKVVSPPTPTPLVPASLWAGTWTIWQNPSTSNDPQYEQTFTLTWTMTSANTITGSYSYEGCTFNDTLTVNPDGMIATGRETSNGCGTWDVTFYMNSNLSQFGGRWNLIGDTSAEGYYCGARAGYGKPNPCKR